jgi:hypothetical protein
VFRAARIHRATHGYSFPGREPSPYTAAYLIARFCPSVVTFPSAISRFITGRIVVAFVPSAAAICSPP